jgi:predicted lipid-binding transport protein (Tim44 family)
VAADFSAGKLSPKLGPALTGLTVQAELRSVAAAFVDLQQARHEADYDASRKFTKKETLDLLDQVEQAFGDWDAVRGTPQADTFLVALLIQRHIQT